jgi:translocation and assembly module TamA
MLQARFGAVRHVLRRTAGVPAGTMVALGAPVLIPDLFRRTARAVRAWRLALHALAAAFALSPAAHAQSEPAADETRPIHFRVVIDAPRPYEKMLEKGLDLMRWQDSERVSLTLLRRLAVDAEKAAAEALAADGYFSPTIETHVEPEAGDQALVRMKVIPGARTRVRGVALDFAGAALRDAEGRQRIDAVKQNWGLAPGAPFTQSEWTAGKAAALAGLARGRYAAAKIASSEAYVAPAEHAADLSLKLDSGPVFHAGPVFVHGLKRYPASVVENFNPHEPGEPYDALKLELYQRRLLETGYFNAVNFRIDPDPDHAAHAPLNVNVIEAPSQKVDTGISVSTDVGAGFSVDYGNADIFNSSHRLRTQLNINQKEQHLGTTIDAPPRRGGTWDTWSARADRSDVEGLVSTEAVFGYAYNWGLLSVPTQASLAAHFEHQSVSGSTTRNNYAVFAQYRKTFRTTRELVSPREGFIGTAEIGTSIPGVSTRTFVRGRVHVNWLIPFGLRNDLLVRGELGAVLAGSRRGIPTSFLFRTGGDQTVRGYAYQSIGVPEGDAVVGGRYLATATVEYTRWITDTIGAAAFVDAGDAFDTPGAIDPAVGVGVGVRYKSPIGPLRADVAYGERDRQVRLHFSVGYQF